MYIDYQDKNYSFLFNGFREIVLLEIPYMTAKKKKLDCDLVLRRLQQIRVHFYIVACAQPTCYTYHVFDQILSALQSLYSGQVDLHFIIHTMLNC